MTRLCGFLLGIVTTSTAAVAATASVDWLDHAPPPPTTQRSGISFGVPWPRGAVPKGSSFRAQTAKGQAVAMQSWPLAYWPDGSLKWTAHAVVAAAEGPFTVSPDQAVAPDKPLAVTDSPDAFSIDTGVLRCVVPKKGSSLLDAGAARNLRLVCTREDRSDYEAKQTIREEDFVGKIESAGLEQSGPVRAVVKLTGKHKSVSSDRAWLPFTVRLYFFAGRSSVRIVHSFVFDGDQEKDFIRGLGVRVDVPLSKPVYDRHVRFAGESGMFAEPLQLLAGRHFFDRQLAAKNLAGQPVPSDFHPNPDLAVWDGYKLVQISPDSYTIEKRTNPNSSWIRCTAGTRSLGTAFLGQAAQAGAGAGGIAIGMKNFWQQSPTELEIEKGSTDAAEMTLWLWSPDSPAMDLRHYDVKGHGLEASYEDYQKGFATATGIARTNEITLDFFDGGVPPNEQLLALAKSTAQPPHLVCSPDYYHSIPVFGVWSLPDRSSPAKKDLQDRLDRAVAFYKGQIEQRHWYGFWDFGDVMHSYDATRHSWRYDVGGFAWANTELMPDLWLWYTFLRTGRGDVFRMAEAMTRHTQEVDVYHLGRFAGLGSRHNVRHWGDGAKELRISQAFLKRPYYYITTDERTGDLIDEVIDADEKLVEIDPLREVEPGKIDFPTHARVGPDWFAMCGNWMTAWERTGDPKYRDRIVTGVKCLDAMPHKFFSGDSYGYDPKDKTLHLLHPDQVAVPHLAALMGGPEVCMELTPLLADVPQWQDAWLNYCRYLQAPADEQRKAIGGTVTNGRGPHFSRMTAYAAMATKDPMLAQRAWSEFFRNVMGNSPHTFEPRRIEGPDVPHAVDEIPFVSTNDTAQWSLNAIELLDLVGDSIPEKP